MIKEELGGHMILLHKVLFHAGFCIMSTNQSGRTLDAGYPVLQPSVLPAHFLDIC